MTNRTIEYFQKNPNGQKQLKILNILQRRLNKEKLESIGKEFGVTRERIRQIETEGIELLIKSTEKKEIDKTTKERINSYQKAIETNINKTRIEYILLPKQTSEALINNSIRTISGLIKRSEKDLLSLERIGIKGVNEIKEKLKEHNRSLKPEYSLKIKFKINDIVIFKNHITKTKNTGKIIKISDKNNYQLIYTIQDINNTKKIINRLSTDWLLPYQT
jgi:hypothetical protein